MRGGARRYLVWALMVTAVLMLVLRFQDYDLTRALGVDLQVESSTPLTQEKIFQLLREAEHEMDERRRRIERVCTKHNLGLYRSSAAAPAFIHPPTPQYSVFFIDRVHKMTYCPIYKAATSTWLHQLLLLAGHTEEFIASHRGRLAKVSRLDYPVADNEVAEEAFRTTLKLIIVRHPFERLLSAYRDKLENKEEGLENGVIHFYNSYGRKIVRKFRNATAPGASQPRPEPTFREFVMYLIHEDPVRYDDHWLPYYLFCTPCLVRYDIIAHVETLLRDQLFAIRTAGLEGVIEPRWKHLTKGSRSAGATAKRYFSKLSKWHVQKLYETYQLDFELFGYEIGDFWDYATAD